MQGVYFKADFQQLYNAIRYVDRDLARSLRHELSRMTKEVALEARQHVPSHMQRGKTGVGWGFLGSKGSYVHAGGRTAPKSWVGSYVGGPSHKGTFRHPVFPQAGSPRSSWNWATQPTKDFLTPIWDRHAAETFVKAEAAVQRVLDEATATSRGNA